VGQASSLAGEMNSAQFYDVLNLVKDKEEMIDVYRRKSGNLFVFSGILGAESKEGSNNLLKLGSLGVAYQIFDDLKDKDEDKALGRKTLLDFVEEGEAKNLAYNYLEESKKVFDNNKFLNNVMDKIVRRRKFYKLLF
jgi:geranylgeranyl pyrophosphate synthase